MRVLLIELTLQIAWAQSLKDKRSVVKGLVEKVGAKFHASVAEAAGQDTHKTAVLAVALLIESAAKADRLKEKIVQYVETATDAELMQVHSDLL